MECSIRMSNYRTEASGEGWCLILSRVTLLCSVLSIDCILSLVSWCLSVQRWKTYLDDRNSNFVFEIYCNWCYLFISRTKVVIWFSFSWASLFRNVMSLATFYIFAAMRGMVHTKQKLVLRWVVRVMNI